MHTKMLIPLDGSRLSEGILPYARSFAKALEIPVKLLHVLDAHSIETFSDTRHGRYLDVIAGEMKGPKIDYLHQVAQSFLNPSMVHYSVSVGKPVQVILEEAASDTDSLIAMATHGRSGIKRWLLGSITDNLLVICSHGRSGSGRWVLGSVANRVVHYSGERMLAIRASAPG